jgi:NAD(P)-dependent dehydrogenase (short-subunit alcohol dehydrogenase family)
MLLRERLEASHGAVINTSSGAHRMGHIDMTDLESTRDYSAWRAYGTAKLMNILHAADINRRFTGVRGVSFHPGVVATGFAREGAILTRILYDTPLRHLFMIPPEKGADTLVWLATPKPQTDWTPGAFYIKRKPAKTAPQASDAELARELWDWSERAVMR